MRLSPSIPGVFPEGDDRHLPSTKSNKPKIEGEKIKEGKKHDPNKENKDILVRKTTAQAPAQQARQESNNEKSNIAGNELPPKPEMGQRKSGSIFTMRSDQQQSDSSSAAQKYKSVSKNGKGITVRPDQHQSDSGTVEKDDAEGKGEDK